MIKYLSPSALMQAEKQPHTFYLTRMFDGDHWKWLRGKQTLAASIGSAFDVLVKEEIGQVADHASIEQNYDEAMEIARRIMFHYRKIIKYTKFVNRQFDNFFTYRGIPIYGRLDSCCMDGDLIVPFDWKCSGFSPESKSGASPKAGYYMRYYNGELQGAHKKYFKDMPMQLIDENWAIQLCTYGWSLGLSPELNDPFPVRVDMQTITTSGKISCAMYRGIITPEFQRIVYAKYNNLWKLIQRGGFEDMLIGEPADWVMLALDEKWY